MRVRHDDFAQGRGWQDVGMLELTLLAGPGSTTVRSFATCLCSVMEVPAAHVPLPTGTTALQPVPLHSHSGTTVRVAYFPFVGAVTSVHC
jgi:DNA mismatch repair protein MutH